MATAPTTQYESDCIIGPDGVQWPRGDDTTAGTGAYYWSVGVATFEADPDANSVANSDTAWFQYVLDQYGRGGIFQVLPHSAGVGVYFDSLGGSGATQGINDDGEFVTIKQSGTTIIASKFATFRFYVNSDSTRLFLCDKTNFTWQGGTFVYDGNGAWANQSFIACTAGADYCTITDAVFQIASATAGVENFACINLAGADAASTFDDAMRQPVISNCRVIMSSIEPASAYTTKFTSGETASNWFQGILLKANDTMELQFQGCTVYADAATTATRHGGGLARLDNCQFASVDNCKVYGVDTSAADGTGGTILLIYTEGGEGGHTTVSNCYFEVCSALYIIDMPNVQYNGIVNCHFGRNGVDAAIHTTQEVTVASSDTANKGDSLVVTGCHFHNNNPANAVDSDITEHPKDGTQNARGYTIHLEKTTAVYIDAYIHSLIAAADKGMRVEATCSNVVRPGNEVIYDFKSGVDRFNPDSLLDSSAFKKRTVRYNSREDRRYFIGKS